jgi:hypothetical protein
VLPAFKLLIHLQQSEWHSFIRSKVDIFFFSQTPRIPSKCCQLKKLFFSRPIPCLCACCRHIYYSLILLNTVVFESGVWNEFAAIEIDSYVVYHSYWRLLVLYQCSLDFFLDFQSDRILICFLSTYSSDLLHRLGKVVPDFNVTIHETIESIS